MKVLFVLISLSVAVYGQTFTLPHGHALAELIDMGFTYLDKNKDGGITFDEVSYLPGLEDLNHDGFITLEEYMKFTNSTLEVATPVFNAYDTDHDGRWPVNMMEAYFHLLDPNGDGVSTKHEYEHYQTSGRTTGRQGRRHSPNNGHDGDSERGAHQTKQVLNLYTRRYPLIFGLVIYCSSMN